MHGDRASFLLTFVTCLEIGSLSRKLSLVSPLRMGTGIVLVPVMTIPSTISLFKALHQLYLINLHDSTAIQGNRDH